MLSLMLVVLALIGCVHAQPIGFKSFGDYDTASLVPLIPAGEMLYLKETSSILISNEKSTTTQSKSSHWISSVLQLLFAAISPGGFVGTCWCSIKCLRNGCEFKRAWVTPKSVAEYKRRKQIQTDQIVHYQPSTITQSISNSLSSQAHQLDMYNL
ncbi:unnamed protein product [Rotaria magnacalcarata]|uniref:Secreted protein n=1 Tax=Rotaria magnacalcarata TaxID=392030 RepID=A0A816YZ05_9BILA|nr:unnamed protein product [Rotaria magnacalcarata]CAF4479141.1 unnamed protein product [Rotaria magnacalcarata]CAF4541828.1 unnamed protein product [Rotaria magnacalcarata]CAF5039567.1 unnamed protein product [Rotaria magnacalcarata]